MRLSKNRRYPPRAWLQRLGPGLITGAADDDPSGIATYSQVGAQYGYGIGWTILLTTPLMIAVQEISARLGCVTGQGLGAAMRGPGAMIALLAVPVLAGSIAYAVGEAFTWPCRTTGAGFRPRDAHAFPET